MKFNYYGFKAIYFHEMNRFLRTVGQSILSPVISTSLYFVVFGSVIGGYIQKIDGVSYGSYIVPGLLMLTLLTQSISNTSFGIFFRCLLYTSPSPRDLSTSRMPSSA